MTDDTAARLAITGLLPTGRLPLLPANGKVR
jgi:hypothetical protein